jgi:hypothetical protein
MNQRVGLRAALLWLCASGAWVDVGAAPTVHFDSFIETKVIGTPLAPGSTLLLDGGLRDSTGSSIDNRLFFRPGSTVLSLSAGWLTAPAENRTVGVNIDLFDFNNNLVATDAFQGVNGGLALSQMLATNLIAGAQYQLVFTGTALQAGRYAIALASDPALPPLPALNVVSPAADAALFDTHVGSKILGRNFVDGDQLFIDGAMPDDAIGTISNDFKFTTTASTLSAGIEWIVGDPNDPQRTIGVNVDILDANNVVVASDTFQGVFDGQAFSQILPVTLLPGTYTARFTGIANLAGRYRIHLSTDTTAPGFDPIVDLPPAAVPEPGSLALAAAALALLLARASTARIRPQAGRWRRTGLRTAPN